MAPDPASGRRSVSPGSSGRDSPIPRQWRNQLGGAEDKLLKDKAFRKYAAGVDKALALFETALEEWADYISFLNRLLRALQARPSNISAIPARSLVAQRLSQCLDPSLPSGVHQKALEIYNYVFSTIGTEGLSRDLQLYLPGLASVLSFASLSVRAPYLDILETYFLKVDPRSLRSAIKSVILALLPGLEDEAAEDFDRTMKLVVSFKKAIRPPSSELLTEDHASGDDYFWQCFFLACITSSGRRPGALAYLVRYLPAQGGATTNAANSKNGFADQPSDNVASIVTSPEPGLLIRCFASGLSDEQLLIQRGFLDLLVTHLPLSSSVLRGKVKSDDLELLMKAAIGVVIRRDMSLNRRLWAWFLGPEPASNETEQAAEPTSPATDHQQSMAASRTSYFEQYGLQPLTRALLAMVTSGGNKNPAERARPYRICLSLMDRWEIGGLVVPEVFLPIIENVRQFQGQASSSAEFSEVLKSASVFFDGIESGLIYSEIVSLLAQALSPGKAGAEERQDKIAMANFILANFNVREEEMVTIHAPLSSLATICMLEDLDNWRKTSTTPVPWVSAVSKKALETAIVLLEMVPPRAFPNGGTSPSRNAKLVGSTANAELLKKIRDFYVNEQGNIEASSIPFHLRQLGELILQKSSLFIRTGPTLGDASVRMLVLALTKMPASYALDAKELLSFLQLSLEGPERLAFSDFSAVVQLSTELHAAHRIASRGLSDLATVLVGHAWRFLSTEEPKFHVETVRCLWQLQTALSVANRDIEAALATVIAESRDPMDMHQCVSDAHTFSVLWSLTLQDNPSDRRGSKAAAHEIRSGPRLAGMEHFEVMLTRPLFLILDVLLDDTTHQYMTVKSWLSNMIGIDRLFLVMVQKFCEVKFLSTLRDGIIQPGVPDSRPFGEEDDLDLCLYYLRTLSNVLRICGDVAWAVLASKHVSFSHQGLHISSGGEEGDILLQDFMVKVCLKCVMADAVPGASTNLEHRIFRLQQFALGMLHHFFLSRHMSGSPEQNLENLFLERLSRAIDQEDPSVQVLLLDVVYDALKLREASMGEAPGTPPSEKRTSNLDPGRTGRPSFTASETRHVLVPPPPRLLQCIQSALTAPGSRSVLDSWIVFLSECLPFYADTIFQVLIPLVETLCTQVGKTFDHLRSTFKNGAQQAVSSTGFPESTLIHLLNGLEQVLARSHDQLLSEEARAQLMRNPDQQQSLFGSMVSGVFQSEGHRSRSATANDRLTVHLAFQDACRICYKIWSWGLGDEAAQQDPASAATFNHTSLRMRNRARRLLEHLLQAENLECLETIIDTWRKAPDSKARLEVFNLLSALEASRPRHTIPALFNSIYSRTNPTALEPSRKSTMTISLEETNLVVFLVEYTRSLDDDAMDEIWQDCIVFLKDLLSNPFPHRQNLPSLLEFAALLGEKVDNTNFGEQRKMRRELGDLFTRLLAALFTTKPITTESTNLNSGTMEKAHRTEAGRRTPLGSVTGSEDVVAILASIVPNLPKILVDSDRVLSAAGAISSNVVGPTIRSKNFPDTVGHSTLSLLHELSRLQNNQKTWKKDVGEAFNDARFFSMHLDLVKDGWMPLLRQWTMADKDKMSEIVQRLTAPTTAGIVFGVGATSARLDADRKAQVNLRRIATLILASTEDAFVADLPIIFDKLTELLGATATSSPSSATRADIYMVVRALVLNTSPVHLAVLWPVINHEIHSAISSITAPANSSIADIYTNAAVLQACKLLDLLICVGPDDFQLHEWLFITDTIDAVYRYSTAQPVALIDELSEELGSGASQYLDKSEAAAHLSASSSHRRPLLGPGVIDDNALIERRDDLVSKILRPFFGQLSIFAFESTYAMGTLDREACVQGLLKDLFDDRSIARAP
ncbi:Dopey, N-terminal-domain-containing protein [Emericellopsis atlantica]|uniref:Dopey, N-terminal-domain-containing protein n=1 Tax=Emericellopsis atlantica TaxID=2614577 RepID=A0A9P7ZSZ7_9HYPO|nr:Dopey, N-terminal-domain-containing protein [Emericellopsis atlantica]KAG9257088.1 Dopey, N-terminal-domain-containing protein [Emericellopsis atlantica]